MKRHVHLTLAVGLSLVVSFVGCSSNSRSDQANTAAQSEQPKASTETDDAKAIAEIENCGGKVIADKEHPGQSWVFFQGSKVTDAGLAQLKGLQTALAKCTILFGSPARARVRSTPSYEQSLVRLLVVEAVQKDLGLNADQIKKVRDSMRANESCWREFNAKIHEIFPPGQSFPSEEAAARQRKLRTLSDDYRNEGKEVRTKFLAILTADQSQRLKQIELQTAVGAALERPEIIRALQISEEQRKKLDVLKDRRLSDEPLPPDLRHLDAKERRQRMIESMKESDKATAAANKLVLDVLSSEQRARFDKLQGKKVEVNWPYDELLPEDFTF